MTSPVTLYSIHAPVGQMARWLPSIDEAKRVYAASVAERLYDDDERRPVVSFEVSSFDDQGEPCAEHVNCLLDGNLDCCIWPERLVWPERNLYAYEGIAKPPSLVMQIDDRRVACGHATLVCANVGDDGVRPAITCDDCGVTWQPAGFARSAP